MADEVRQLIQTIEEVHYQTLLEKGLSRMKHNFDTGDVGIVAAANSQDNPGDTKKKYHELINHIRSEYGKQPVATRGKTKLYGHEQSVTVPGLSADQVKKIGARFKQNSVIHVSKGQGTMHYLEPNEYTGAKAGDAVAMGKVAFNQPNPAGRTVLKGRGYSIRGKPEKVEDEPSRSFTFKEGTEEEPFYIYEEVEYLAVPPWAISRPHWAPYT